MARDGKPRRVLSTEEWLTVRAEWERTGAPLRELSRKWGIAVDTIKKRKGAQNWKRDPTDEVQRRTLQKVARKSAERMRENTQPEEEVCISPHVELPQLPVAMTEAEVIEAVSEERAAVILRHQQEWRDFEKERQAAIAVFYQPEIRLRTVTKGEDVVSVEEIRDYSKIDMVKKLAESLLIKHRGERLAHSLEHNLNTDKAADIAKRDEMIRTTFDAIREAARRAQRESTTIDVTPNKESEK